MRRRQGVLFVATVLLVATLATGTSGFSAVEADRGVQVAVAGDDAAYLGFAQRVETLNNTTNLTVELTNRLPSGVGLAVEVAVGDQSRTLALGAGERRETEAFVNVTCGEPITVAASGDGVAIELARTVECE